MYAQKVLFPLPGSQRTTNLHRLVLVFGMLWEWSVCDIHWECGVHKALNVYDAINYVWVQNAMNTLEY